MALDTKRLMEVAAALDRIRAERAVLDEREAALEAEARSIVGENPATKRGDEDENDVAEAPSIDAGSKAGMVLSLVRAGTFSTASAASAIYGTDTPENRKKVRSSLKYLARKEWILRTPNGWEATNVY